MNIKKLKERTHEGFTLIEMVVVLAIIGILLLTLIPSFYNYYTNSRLNSANSDAKVLFNSTQTIMQEYEFAERSADTSFFYGATKNGTLMIKGSGSSQAGSGAITDAVGSTAAVSDYNGSPATFGGRLARLYPNYDSTAWCVYIDGYTVRCAVTATTGTSDYVGGYPVRASVKHDTEVIGNSSVGSVSNAEMAAYAARCWS